MKPGARIRGCLLGGAVGDALGAPVEFASLARIRAAVGPQGVRDFLPEYGRRGAITDDTQMTLFTAEGLIRAEMRFANRGICHRAGVIHHAYLRWLLTQDLQPASSAVKIGTDGWLFGVRSLHHRRAPGRTCCSALQAAQGFGIPEIAANNSKGCGGVMRMAPVGLLGAEPGRAFDLGTEAAALTHGHPSGHLAAGFLACLIGAITGGMALPAALDAASAELCKRPRHQETQNAVAAARALAARGGVAVEDIETLGGGWVAEEALAIAVCCALAAETFADAALLAVNHSGDSDSTGAIAGNIMGALMGEAAIPPKWLAALEVREEIAAVADDLAALAGGTFDFDAQATRYPGW